MGGLALAGTRAIRRMFGWVAYWPMRPSIRYRNRST